jgi:hypothetical protein
MSIAHKKPAFDGVAEWPEQAGNPRAGIGGNKPPLEELIPAEFRTALLADRPDFLTKFGDLVSAADRAQATNDDELGRCGNLVKSYRALQSHIDETHKIAKAPYLEGGRLVDAEKNALRQQVDAAKVKVEAIGNAYQAKKDAEAKAERDRIAAEQRAAAERAAAAERERIRAEQEAQRAVAAATNQAERDAARAIAEQASRDAEIAMAEAALAPAAVTKAEPVRSDEGATVSGTQEWRSEILDYSKAFKFVKGDARVREAMDKAIQALTKTTKGQFDMGAAVRVWPVSKANFR